MAGESITGTVPHDDREALFAEASFHVESVASIRIVGEWMPVAHVGVSDKVYVVTGGRGTLLLDDGRFDLRRGRVMLIPAGARQQGFTDERSPLEKHWIHFGSWTGGTLQLLRFVDLPLCLEGGPARRITTIAERMHAEWQGNAPGRRLALRMLLLDMLLTAYRAPAKFRRGPDGPGLEPSERRSMDDAHTRAVRRVLTALSTRYAEPITLKALADEHGWTPAHLSESFRKLVGMPPMRFLEGVRMRRAQELLAASAEPVHRIAEMVGYADANYFSRAFTRHTGVTARAYREASQTHALRTTARDAPRKSRNRQKPVQ